MGSRLIGPTATAFILASMDGSVQKCATADYDSLAANLGASYSHASQAAVFNPELFNFSVLHV